VVKVLKFRSKRPVYGFQVALSWLHSRCSREALRSTNAQIWSLEIQALCFYCVYSGARVFGNLQQQGTMSGEQLRYGLLSETGRKQCCFSLRKFSVNKDVECKSMGQFTLTTNSLNK
jgi:hypothetical protein